LVTAVRERPTYDALQLIPAAPSLIPVGADRVASRDWSPWTMAAALFGAVIVVGGSYWWWLAQAPKSTAGAPAVVPADPGPAAAPAAEPRAPPRAAAPPSAPPEAASATPLRRHEPPPSRPLITAAAGAEDELVIRGNGECWVEVYGPSGARLFFDLVRDGETRRLPGPGPWRVFLGYVDAVHLSVGDRTVVIPAARRTAATARVVIATDGAVR
jgi:Domain of unknown function (DUF4115)